MISRTASDFLGAPWLRRILLLALPFTILLGLVSSTARGAPVSVPFTSDGTWTVPADAAQIDILVVGAGGGGGGFQPDGAGGGGGGGAVEVCTDIAVAPGQTLSSTVGNGGLFTTGDADGTSGGASSLALGGASVCQANGGEGGFGTGLSRGYDGGNSGNGKLGGTTAFFRVGGGGAGTGANGGDSNSISPMVGGAGGSGVTPASLPTPGLFADSTTTFYGGGGGGGFSLGDGGSAGPGGAGGGGAGAPSSASRVGGPNTGGGGGGGSSDFGAGGNGGSGYVELRYEPAPVNTAQPSVSGSELVGSTISTTNGSWSNNPTGYAYSWQRCNDDAGAGCVDIGSAGATSYTSTNADVGKYLRSRVTATNVGGSISAFSSNYLLVRAPTPDPPGPTPPDPTINATTPKAEVTRNSVLVSSKVRVSGAGTIAQRATTGNGKKTRTWCRASKTAANAGTHTLNCNLGKKGRAALRKSALKLTLRTTFTPTTGSAVTVNRKLTLKRRR